MPPIFKFEGNKSGGPGRDRTGDLLHAMQALSQLSYRPVQILYQIFQHICDFLRVIMTNNVYSTRKTRLHI